MQSQNFEILRKQWPEMASLAGFAEKYTLSDPPSALIKLRTFAECVVGDIYDKLGWSFPFQPSLFDLLNTDDFKDNIPKVILDKFHLLRIHGNKAVHSSIDVSPALSEQLLRETHDIAKWFYITLTSGSVKDCSEFVAPEKTDYISAASATLSDSSLSKKQIASREIEYQEILLKIAEAREAQTQLEQEVLNLEQVKHSAESAVSVLDFNEATTRQFLIDTELVTAGWKVGTKGANTHEVTQEEDILHQPTDSGIGYADYVLWDDNHK